MLFETGESLAHLYQSTAWFADGTFSTASKLFKQLFTLYFLKDFKAFLAVFGILANKKQKIFFKIFEV
jgi:hypothetical protein